MSANPETQPVRAYFLIDRTQEMESRINLIERQIRDLMERLERDPRTRSRVQSAVISMEAATSQVIERPAAGQFQLPRGHGCDLGEALQLVENSLGAPGQENGRRVEVFVLVHSEPGGDWRPRIEALKARRARVTVIAFGTEAEIGRETLMAIRTWDKGARRLDQFTADRISEAFDLVYSLLSKTVETAREKLPGQSISPQPQVPSEIRATGLGEGPAPGGLGQAARAGLAEQPEAELPPKIGRVVQHVATMGGENVSEAGSNQPLSEQRLPSAPNATGPVAGTSEEPDSPPARTEPPPVDEEGVATIWKDVEPPAELPDRVDHTVTQVLDILDAWRMIGASRRGKMHAHKGIFREDAFALGQAEGWHLMVVADGGGSCSLSRVGSQLAANTAVETMAGLVKSMSGASLPAEKVCGMALRQGLEEAWKALSAEAERREIALRELGTTFLALMHRPDPEGHIVGVAQVGDGLVAVELTNGAVKPLAEPDVGETAGVTLFLTSKPWQEWLDRVGVGRLSDPPKLLAAMCDGVADDFIPFDQNLGKLFDRLSKVIEQEQPAEALLQLLGYDKRGSFDDRTLTLIYQARSKQELEAEAKSAAERQTIEFAPATRLLEAEPKDGPKIEAQAEEKPGEEKPEAADPASGPPPDTDAPQA